MLRASRRVAKLHAISAAQGDATRLPISAFCFSRRPYTPIYKPDDATDRSAPIRHADELRALWARQIPIPSLGRAIEAWLRFGNDPVLHTALPTRHLSGYLEGDLEMVKSEPKVSSSPFAYVEDYMGTNLVRDDPVHIKESAAVWREYFEKKYSIRLRQSRRTASNFIGRLNAPEVFTDEADQPNTKWTSEVHFREMAYLSETHLKEKVTNPLQLEEILWYKSDVSAFLAFFQACQQETATRIPLPVPSVWVYEGDACKQWAEKYLPVTRAAHTFFNQVLAADLKKFDSPTELLKRVAAALRQVHAVLLRRRERQQRLGIFCAQGWAEASKAEKEAWTANEVERWQRSVHEGIYDPEDLLEVSDFDGNGEWSKENEAISEILNAPIQGCSFTLQEFWMHTIRREALETEHILVNERLCEIDAAARRALYDTTESYASILEALEESIAKGWLDIRATVFQPHPNPVWCALHYVKFGASSVVQHTNTAKRQLLFHYAASLNEVAAAALLYYSTKPRSERLDYASPNTLRRSLTQLCATYALDMTHAAQRPILLSAANLAKAEDVIQRISWQVARPFGRRRRARHAQARLRNQKFLPAVSDIQIAEVEPELLEVGEDLTSRWHASRQGRLEPISAWPMGSRKAVHYHWPTPSLEKLRQVLQRANIRGNSPEGLTEQQVVELQSLHQQGVLEISLWRRQTRAEMQAAKERDEHEEKELTMLTEAVPELKEISEYARTLYKRLNREEMAASHTGESFQDTEDEAEDEEEWTFALMLDDKAPLNGEEVREVYLPFTDSTGKELKEGEYRVRVRAYDVETNPSGHPTLCSEAFSNSFKVTDALPKLLEEFIHINPSCTSSDGVEKHPSDGRVRVLGEKLIDLCEFLREKGGLDIPLDLEFELGQELDAKGTFSLDRLGTLLRGNTYHRSLAEHGITDAQRGVESKCRAHWTLYHAGANEEEWSCARRGVLDEAMARQRDWWLEDPILEVEDVATDSVDGNLDPTSYVAMMRYGAELCTVSSASGSTHEADRLPLPPGVVDKHLRADCTVDGTGGILSLRLGDGAGTAAGSVSIDQALAAALAATQRAQDRHRTLSMFKLGPIEKQAQALNFCGIYSSEMGGKYARTFCYALDKAKEELAETAAVGRRALGTEDLDTERRSDMTTVDRFASDTHPEQRKNLFTPRITFSGVKLDDPTPDQTSTWGR
ncbi:unnamed protein product [Phytomonas sp. EM1]|nr:unnamed protein product [Phytomonas sp. EM1]|eukprot:CCW61953.1 unnamed protein product [Phytomonas sp. isolate EM1]